MRPLPSIKILIRDYKLPKDELFKIMHSCLKYYLSEEELQDFIYEHYQKLEKKYRRKYVCHS